MGAVGRGGGCGKQGADLEEAAADPLDVREVDADELAAVLGVEAAEGARCALADDLDLGLDDEGVGDCEAIEDLRGSLGKKGDGGGW